MQQPEEEVSSFLEISHVSWTDGSTPCSLLAHRAAILLTFNCLSPWFFHSFNTRRVSFRGITPCESEIPRNTWESFSHSGRQFYGKSRNRRIKRINYTSRLQTPIPLVFTSVSLFARAETLLSSPPSCENTIRLGQSLSKFYLDRTFRSLSTSFT